MTDTYLLKQHYIHPWIPAYSTLYILDGGAKQQSCRKTVFEEARSTCTYLVKVDSFPHHIFIVRRLCGSGEANSPHPFPRLVVAIETRTNTSSTYHHLILLPIIMLCIFYIGVRWAYWLSSKSIMILMS